MINRDNIQQALPGLEPAQVSQLHEQMDQTASQVTSQFLAQTPSGADYVSQVQLQTRAMSLGREVAWAQMSEEIEARTPDWSRQAWLEQDLPPKIASFFTMENRWQALTSQEWFYPEEWMIWYPDDPEHIEELKTQMIDWIERTIIPQLHEHMFIQKLGSTSEMISQVIDSNDNPELLQYNKPYMDLASLKHELMNVDEDQADPSVWSQEPSLLEWERFETMLWTTAVQLRWEVEEDPDRQLFPWASQILKLKGPGPNTFKELLAVVPPDLILVG